MAETKADGESLRSVGWAIAFAVLVALSVPWFLWDDGTVVAGLPVWLWWHVGWMVVTSVTFASFASRAWGLWVEEVA
ncbi:hypothetical protein BRC81_12265 [Halobacteriales archaeon QS_1_68_20]|nr:MAG: hypothetical protein BRC81_12265 [Halobacteriales archaeon QS_1_68_20]